MDASEPSPARRGKRGTVLAAIVAATMLPACGSEGPDDDPSSAADEAFELFMQRSHRLDDGRLVIDGDILVPDEAAAREYFDRGSQITAERLHGEHAGETEGFRISVETIGGVDQKWAFPANTRLTYCIDTASFGANANTLVAAFERAGDSWAQGAGVYFDRKTPATCDNTTNSVTFNVRLDPAATFFGSAFFPGYARADREVIIGPDAFTTVSGGRDLEGILRHELGHTLGFRHEHIWVVCTGETPLFFDLTLGVNVDARALTPYDVNSVMHYPQCRPSGTGGYRQTELDHEGAISLYGLNSALIGSAAPL
jgi:serralysin